MRRPRFTVRTLMIAVAVFAGGTSILLGLRNRKREFRAYVQIHRADAARLIRQHHPRDSALLQRRVEHHLKMGVKYERAARYPWLPVEPDPPEPE